MNKPIFGLRTSGVSPKTTTKEGLNAEINDDVITPLWDRIEGLTGPLRYAGAWDASTGAFPSGAVRSDVYRASVAGTVDGVSFVVNDRIIAISDTPSTATLAGNWDKADVGLAGGAVGLDDTQNITNKTINMGDNTVEGADGVRKQSVATVAGLASITDEMVAIGGIVSVDEKSYVRVADDATDSWLIDGAGGIKFDIASDLVTPAFWGIPLTGGGECGADLQKFFDYVAANNVQADWTGEYEINTPITFGTLAATTGVPKSKEIKGFMVLKAVGAMDKMFSVRQHYFAKLGCIECIGEGGIDYSTRTCNVGVYLENTGRTSFEQIRGVALRFGAVVSRSAVGINNNLVYLGKVTAKWVGSGMADHGPYTGYNQSSLSAGWSNPVNAGSSGSSGQTTTIDVGADLPDFISDGRYGAVGSTPYGVWIGDRLYYITAASSGSVTVTPWVDSALTSGTLQYHFGAAVHLGGGDSSVIGFESIDAFVCGAGLAASALYPPSGNRFTSQFCGVGLILGTSIGGAIAGGSIQDGYFEADRAHIVAVSRLASSVQHFTIHQTYELELSRCYNLTAARLADNSFRTADLDLPNLVIGHQGKRLAGEGQALGSVQTFTRSPGDKYRGAYANSLTVILDDADADINRLYGSDSTSMRVFGTGGALQPTGTVTFSCPAGWKINGGTLGANLAVSGFAGPPMFSILWRHSASEILISKIETNPNDIDVTLTIASGASATMPEVTGNKFRAEFTPNNRPKYGGSFGAFSTEVPVDMGSGARVFYSTVAGGTTADDQIRVYPNSGNQITFQNNTTVTQNLRVIARVYS